MLVDDCGVIMAVEFVFIDRHFVARESSLDGANIGVRG